MSFRGSIQHNVASIIKTPSSEYIRQLRGNMQYTTPDNYMYYLVIVLIILGCIRLIITIAYDTVAFHKKYTPYISPQQIAIPIEHIPLLCDSNTNSSVIKKDNIGSIININYRKHTVLHLIKSINASSTRHQEYKE